MKKGTQLISLAIRQKLLLDKLVEDTCNQLPVEERNINKISVEALIWNLFKSNKNYQFNVRDIKYIIDTKQNTDIK